MTTKRRVTIREASIELRKLGFELQWKSCAGNDDRLKVTRQYKLTAASGEIFVRLEPKGIMEDHSIWRWHLTENGPGCYKGNTLSIHFSTLESMRKLIIQELARLKVLRNDEQPSDYGGEVVAHSL